ncbi:cobalamin-dependent protein [Candidatus Woesearchaeota archaeon]|nr:cobalamin-dependent protein [Candidatus Woesearchaeota archaeon]
MKVFLALPPHSLEERYNKSLAKAAGTLPPLGILYLAAVLKQHGHEVQVCDGSMQDYATMIDRIRTFRPDFIGFSTMAFIWRQTKQMIQNIKRELPHVTIALGGNHATIYKKRCLTECPEADLIMFGECEQTLTEVVHALEKKKSLAGIKGIIYRKGKQLVQNEDRPLITDLDSLPFPARDLLPIKDYTPAMEQYRRKPVTNVMTSRGCPFQCTFCTSRNTGMRLRSPANVVLELKELVDNYGIREVAFWDDTFTLNQARVRELCRLIKEAKLDIVWSAHSRVNTLTVETAQAMKEAGCWKIFFGVESLVQKNLDTIKKGITVQQAFDAIKITNELGIESECSFMFGIPGETYEEALQTISLIKKLNPTYAKFFQHTFFEGQERAELEKVGTLITEDLENVTGNTVTFVPHSMTREQLEGLVPTAYRQFYLRPKYVFNYVKRMRSVEDVKRAMNGFRAVISMKSP